MPAAKKAVAKKATPKAAVKSAAKKAAVQAPAKKATSRTSALKQHLEAPAKAAAARRTAKKATGDPAKSTAAKPAPAKRTVKVAHKQTGQTALVNPDEVKAVRGIDSETTIVFERTFPSKNMHMDWAEAGRRAARDTFSAPVSTKLDVREVKAGTKVRATFTPVRGLPTPR